MHTASDYQDNKDSNTAAKKKTISHMLNVPKMQKIKWSNYKKEFCFQPPCPWTIKALASNPLISQANLNQIGK